MGGQPGHLLGASGRRAAASGVKRAALPAHACGRTVGANVVFALSYGFNPLPRAGANVEPSLALAKPGRFNPRLPRGANL